MFRRKTHILPLLQRFRGHVQLFRKPLDLLYIFAMELSESVGGTPVRSQEIAYAVTFPEGGLTATGNVQADEDLLQGPHVPISRR
jgi:hypothetical protein